MFQRIIDKFSNTTPTPAPAPQATPEPVAPAPRMAPRGPAPRAAMAPVATPAPATGAVTLATPGESDPAAPRRRPRRRRKPANPEAPGQQAPTRQQRDRSDEPRPRAPRPMPEAGPLERTYSFGSLLVSEPIRRALDEMGYNDPTPIQEQAVPAMLDGRDMVGRAQTGTGKTTAFGIPMMELLDPTRREIQGIVLAPTRELAVQVTGELRRLGTFRGIKAVTLYGGQRIEVQLKALEQVPQIIVGTPGRVQDHMARGTIRLNNVRIAILDEADQMLDIGFADDMIRILRATPNQRQTALFSATVPSFIRRMIKQFQRDPLWIGIGGESEAADTIRQTYYEVAQQDKLAGLQEVLRTELEGEKALIFCRTQVAVDRLARNLQRARFQVEPIHGGMRQNQRESVMRSFRAGALRVLVATNVAARGLDIPEISHVINYDMPGNLEEYIHRIGRTGRIGNEGTSVTFVAENDFDMLETIKKHVGDILVKGRLTLYAT